MIWFLGLIPITYLLGRVWCGWVCHLGALQEFIYIPNRFAFLKGERAQNAMRVMRYTLFVALIVQLVATRENLFIHIDPFKVAFNLRSFYATGWILLGMLLLSSLYIYRPFCKSVCPVGLALGWVSRIPGALRLGKNENCRMCRRCSSNCEMHAVDREINSKTSECMMCGACVDICKKDAIVCVRNSCDGVFTDRGGGTPRQQADALKDGNGQIQHPAGKAEREEAPI